MRYSDAQTGGVGERLVKHEKVPPKGQTAGDAAWRMWLMVPLLEGLGLKSHLRKLITNYAAHFSHKLGEPVAVIHGTKVREVTEARLLTEQKILEEGNLSRHAEVNTALQALAKCGGKKEATTKRERGSYVHELQGMVTDVALLLASLDEEEGDEDSNWDGSNDDAADEDL